MDLYTGISMSQNVYDIIQTNVSPELTGSSLPLTFHHEFLKGKPVAIGSAIIGSSLIQIALGINACFHIYYTYVGPTYLFTGIVYWASVFYIITGSLMIAGRNKPSICLVNSSLILNIINSFISCVGIALAAIDVHVITSNCYRSFQTSSSCTRFEGMATSCIFLVINVLLLFIFIYAAVSGGRSMKHVPSIPQAYQPSEMHYPNIPV